MKDLNYTRGHSRKNKKQKASFRIERWSTSDLYYHERVRLVDKLQIQLMNHIIAGENTKKKIVGDVREAWKLMWNNTLRNLCKDLVGGKDNIPGKNALICGLNSCGFDLEAYINAGFSSSRLLDGLLAYMLYLVVGIEKCKIPKQSYIHLLKSHNEKDLQMPPLSTNH